MPNPNHAEPWICRRCGHPNAAGVPCCSCATTEELALLKLGGVRTLTTDELRRLGELERAQADARQPARR
jgi:hypothetical protein